MVDGMNVSFLKIKFKIYDREYLGQIHISEVGRVKGRYIENLNNEYKIGDKIAVEVIDYNRDYRIYNLKIIP